MDSPDISDLLAHITRPLKTVVVTVHRGLVATESTMRKAPGEKVKLSLCEGKVISKLSREEIYGHTR